MGVRSGGCYFRYWTTQPATPPDEQQIGGVDTTSNTGGTSGTETLCADVEWPAQYTWAYHQYRRGYSGPYNWMGSLAYGSRDASGLHYRRNRFYDAESGRFTQEDPIGMAGGINVYGFANGDPVTYSDPYGLKADSLFPVNQAARDVLGQMVLAAAVAIEFGDERQAEGGRAILTMLNDLVESDERVFFSVDPNGGRSATGPLRDGSGIGSLVNPNQSAKRIITVRGAHELGHAWAMVKLGAVDPRNSDHRRTQNQVSVRFENHMRAMYRCPRRPVHGRDIESENPTCQP